MAFLSRYPFFDLLLTALAPTIWGTTYIVTTQFLPPDRPFIAALLRVLPAGFVLLCWCRHFPLRGEGWKLIITGILNIGAFQALLFVAAYRLPGGLAAVTRADHRHAECLVDPTGADQKADGVTLIIRAFADTAPWLPRANSRLIYVRYYGYALSRSLPR